MCELIKFTRNFEWFVLRSRLGESSLQKDCCWYSNSPTTVTNKSLWRLLSPVRSHKTNNCYPWDQTIYQTLNYQLVPHCSLHQVHLRIKIKTIFEKRDQNCCALKTLVRSPNVKWFCVCVQNMHLTKAQETCTPQYHKIAQSCSEHVGQYLFVCLFFVVVFLSAPVPPLEPKEVHGEITATTITIFLKPSPPDNGELV